MKLRRSWKQRAEPNEQLVAWPGCASDGLCRKAAPQAQQKTQEGKRRKNRKNPKKGFRKKAADQAKTLRFEGVGPKSANPQAPQNPQKKQRKKQGNLPKRAFEKKRPIKPKPCVLKGLARKAASAPSAKKSPQKHKKKEIQNDLKVFWPLLKLCLRQLHALWACRRLAATPASPPPQTRKPCPPRRPHHLGHCPRSARANK